MKFAHLFSTVGLVAAIAFSSACKKQEDKAAAPPAMGSSTAGSATAGSAMAGSDTSGSAMAGSAAAGSAVVADDTADHIVVLARHQPAKPVDPVSLTFDKFTVTKAAFDPKNLEGGTATIELDLASFHTDSDKRDGHVKSEAYLDVGKFATATIDIANVKAKSGSTYTADATVAAHGLKKTYPVSFDVVSTTDDSVRIKGEQAFKRADFSVGTDPATDAQQQVSEDLVIQVALTLKKT